MAGHSYLGSAARIHIGHACREEVGVQQARTAVVPLAGPVQHYAWGSPSAIPDLLGVAQDGRPWAELWLGTHPRGPATALAPEGPTALPALLQEQGQPPLPFLLKLLAAAAPLSLQVHPDRRQAEEGYACEQAAQVPVDALERSYRDPHPKPELVVALTPFRALAGFRHPLSTLRVLSELDPALLPPFGPLQQDPSGKGAAATLSSLLSLPEGDAGELLEVAGRAAARAGLSPECDRAADLLQRLLRHHPGDVGALAALLLEDVELAPGEALFQPAGVLHAYIEGLAVELMAASDNVLRAGLTTKHVDVPALMGVLRQEVGGAHRVLPEPLSSPEHVRYPVPVTEFALECLALRETGQVCQTGPGPSLCLVTAGTVELGAPGSAPLRLDRGGAAYVAPSTALRLRGPGTSFWATSGGSEGAGLRAA